MGVRAGSAAAAAAVVEISNGSLICKVFFFVSRFANHKQKRVFVVAVLAMVFQEVMQCFVLFHDAIFFWAMP